MFAAWFLWFLGSLEIMLIPPLTHGTCNSNRALTEIEIGPLGRPPHFCLKCHRQHNTSLGWVAFLFSTAGWHFWTFCRIGPWHVRSRTSLISWGKCLHIVLVDYYFVCNHWDASKLLQGKCQTSLDCLVTLRFLTMHLVVCNVSLLTKMLACASHHVLLGFHILGVRKTCSVHQSKFGDIWSVFRGPMRQSRGW